MGKCSSKLFKKQKSVYHVQLTSAMFFKRTKSSWNFTEKHYLKTKAQILDVNPNLIEHY